MEVLSQTLGLVCWVSVVSLVWVCWVSGTSSTGMSGSVGGYRGVCWSVLERCAVCLGLVCLASFVCWDMLGFLDWHVWCLLYVGSLGLAEVEV